MYLCVYLCMCEMNVCPLTTAYVCDKDRQVTEIALNWESFLQRNPIHHLDPSSANYPKMSPKTNSCSSLWLSPPHNPLLLSVECYLGFTGACKILQFEGLLSFSIEIFI